MMPKCSICRLPSPALAVVDAALRENMPLKVISERTGLSVSSIWRHGRHSVKAEGAAAPQKVTRPPKTAVPAPVVSYPEPADTETKRLRAEGRLERLWNESMEGLEESKTPVVLTKADGSVVEVHDNRARAAFIRCGRDIVDSQAKLAGLYDAPATQNFATVVFDRVILLPKLPSAELPPGPVVDAAPEPAALTDGGTPDREK